MMRQLQAIALDPHAVQPGKPPRMEWLSIGLLVIDDAYQRSIERRGEINIRRIAAEFQWRKFSPVMVAPVTQGRFAIIDGQHRTTAALSLGYERVPCYIVDAKPNEAAAIFAAVNGNTTSLSILQVFRAARSAGEEWAVEVDQVCKAAGITALSYNIAASRTKPYDTLAINVLRDHIKRQGRAHVTLALRCLVATIDSAKLGFFNTKRIRSMCYILSLHPGWAIDEAFLIESMSAHNLNISDFVNVEAALVRKLGQGRAAGAAWAEIVERVRGYHDRKFKASMIAGITHLPHAEVQRAIDEIIKGAS